MSISQRVTQNQVYLRKGKEETDRKLLEEILNPNNLNKSYKKVVANKGVAGVDGITVKEELDYLKENGDRIKNQIRKRRYKPQPVKRVQIPKENGKMRNLGIPTVTDRIIQQAIFQVISPIFEKQFNNNSFGFRPGKSCEQAVIKALEYLNDGYEWIVKPTYVGTPQGGKLSPLLSNIMLNELDKELEERGLNFVRYADDCIILVKSEKAANRVLISITKFIEKKLGLKVNAEKSKVTRPTKTKYLGFSFWKSPKGQWKPKPHLKSYQKLIRKLKQLTNRSWSISLDNRIWKMHKNL